MYNLIPRYDDLILSLSFDLSVTLSRRSNAATATQSALARTSCQAVCAAYSLMPALSHRPRMQQMAVASRRSPSGSTPGFGGAA